MSDSIPFSDWFIHLQRAAFIYWTCPSAVKDARSGESQGKSEEEKTVQLTNKQPILNWRVVGSVDTPQCAVGLLLSGRKLHHSQSPNMFYSPVYDIAADLHRLPCKCQALRPICYPNVSCDHVKGQWEGRVFWLRPAASVDFTAY